MKETKPTKPYAFILGHGLWNDLGYSESISWIDQVQKAIRDIRPYLKDADAFSRRLFVSPSAAGEEKPDRYILTQGNKAIQKYEKFMRENTPGRGLDFLGTYNMSVQSTIPDGTHSGIRVNILKAMTVLNWLDMLEY